MAKHGGSPRVHSGTIASGQGRAFSFPMQEQAGVYLHLRERIRTAGDLDELRRVGQAVAVARVRSESYWLLVDGYRIRERQLAAVESVEVVGDG